MFKHRLNEKGGGTAGVDVGFTKGGDLCSSGAKPLGGVRLYGSGQRQSS